MAENPKAAPQRTKNPLREYTGKMLRKSLLGRKVGMTQIFDEKGVWVPVTVLEVGPCTVLQVKTPERDGYSAVQIGYGERRKQPRKPQSGLFSKIGVKPLRWIREVPFVEQADLLAGAPGKGGASPEPAEAATAPAAATAASDEGKRGEEAPKDAPDQAAPSGSGAGEAQGLKPGDRLGVGALAGVKRVDVGGISKGRGFSGVIRRHHFNAGPKSHGTKNIREPGSTGMHTDPGRVLKGKRMPGHLGASRTKVRNLRVVQVNAEANLLLVEGAVPGPNGGLVYVEESLRKK